MKTPAKKRRNGLTQKQRTFCDRYLEIGNASEAYRHAYAIGSMSDHAIRTEASRLLRNPNIALRLSTFNDKVETVAKLSFAQHMEELRELRDMAKAKGQMGAAIKAEELRGKLRRFYVDQKHLEHGFDRMSAADLRAFVVKESMALGLTKAEHELTALF
jgi:phage terminase small subunit